MDEEHKYQAIELFQQAYERQMDGKLEDAVEWYQKSLELYPTAEAHTFLGWTYSFMGRYDEAIQECLRAIEVDPEFGNPYNDIGAYLIELGKPDEAVPWLKQATVARRYESRCFPHFNLGRIYEQKGEWMQALQAYQRSLDANPAYPLAQRALNRLRALMG